MIIYKHAIKNALIPVVTIVGGPLGTLLAGTVIVETIFVLPGMGRLTVGLLHACGEGVCGRPSGVS